MWLAATRLREERERACDDQVLRSGAKPSAYATHLLEIARGLRAARATALASVAMARPAQLATRLIDVLDPRRRRDTLSPRSRPVALAVLQSAKGISSDYEMAQLLLAVIAKVTIDDAIRAAIRQDAQTLESQYERGRVFEALDRKSGRAELD